MNRALASLVPLVPIAVLALSSPARRVIKKSRNAGVRPPQTVTAVALQERPTRRRPSHRGGALRGELAHIRIVNSIRIRPDDLRAFLDRPGDPS
jgi:hypothetical protein